MSNKIAAAILAGGKARRLGGIAKGNIVVAAQMTIIEHLLNQLHKTEIEEIVISANDSTYQQYGKTVIFDTYVDIGPLAGIEAVLQYYADEAQYAATLFLPCDMPNITAEAIQKLINQYKLSHAEIVFAATHKEQWHPLCAVINNSVLPKINALIECDVYRVSEAWQNCRAETILFADEKQFANCNSWQDFL